jgi:hypothetical protein
MISFHFGKSIEMTWYPIDINVRHRINGIPNKFHNKNPWQ